MTRWLATILLLAGPALAQPPAAAFFRHPALSDAVLSPSGKFIAARVDLHGRDVLAVIDAAPHDGAHAVTIVAGDSTAAVAQFQWVNDERLAYTEKSIDASDDSARGPGIFAVNRDGSVRVQLAERDALVGTESTHIRHNRLPWRTYLMPPGAQDSDDIYVTTEAYGDGDSARQSDSFNLLRVNTFTGTAHAMPRPGPVQQWWLDQQGAPRLAVTRERTVATLYYRDPASDTWRALASYDAWVGGKNVLNPVGFGPDGALYATKTVEGATASLVRIDLATGKAGDALVVAPGYDVNARLVHNSAALLGVDFVTDTRTQSWFAPTMRTLQAQVDQALPETINLMTVAADPAAPHVLVESFSDQVPPRYALLDKASGRLDPIGASYPQIDSAQMGHQRMIRYTARDGLVIPALLTLPPGGGKHVPMVVLVHGGPWQRGPAWEWRPESQFLASRGYAVLEPHFRGSTGLGYRHFAAGFKQWGLAMQDDLADGARWAIGQGYADAARICIAGASYGGYAALMGLIRDPGLYRCGVAWTGVTDIGMLYADYWNVDSDVSDAQRQLSMPRLIGDPVADAAQLQATSPIAQASRITQPLLLAYGGADHRVPLVQGRLFYDKVKQTDPNVEWIDYANEGHGWDVPEHAIDFWTRVALFLDKNSGPAAPQVQSDVSKQQ